MVRPIIAVVGATGAQGGGLVRTILADNAFAARAITRKPDSDKGRALKDAGADVVAADIDDVDSLTKALAGADAAFFVTNFWEHFSPDKELTQAQNLAQAAKRAGLKHVVWSTLEDTREDVPLSDDHLPTLQGKYKVPHFDAKGEADKTFRELGVPTTFLRAAFYWENFIYFAMGPRRGEDGKLDLVLPMGDKKLAGIAAEDIGRVAYGIFKKGPSLIGQTLGAAGDHLTGQQYAEKMSAALGEPVRYQDIAPEVYRSLGFPGAEDLGNMFQHHQEFESKVLSVRSVEKSRELNPQLQSFDTWLKGNGKNIPVPPKA